MPPWGGEALISTSKLRAGPASPESGRGAGGAPAAPTHVRPRCVCAPDRALGGCGPCSCHGPPGSPPPRTQGLARTLGTRETVHLSARDLTAVLARGSCRSAHPARSAQPHALSARARPGLSIRGPAACPRGWGCDQSPCAPRLDPQREQAVHPRPEGCTACSPPNTRPGPRSALLQEATNPSELGQVNPRTPSFCFKEASGALNLTQGIRPRVL